ncbi:hypothetical protein NDU88_001919 [Pleurodeles waltl]|uniref:Uncharacterized protein n=1 Tax=Pleurodeles waltl TaxID=8319 RepID=A0AAV7UAT6_PLEWA|nr:hypothetical protein NDU88_001919 [Pleurodeles waltl]
MEAQPAWPWVSTVVGSGPEKLGERHLVGGGGDPWTWPAFRQGGGEDEGAPVTRGFLEGIFASLRDNIQAVKRNLSQDLKVMGRELEEVGKRVASLEEHENAKGEEVQQLQQEILQLQDQQIELQAHAEELENRSRRNNIRI